MTISEKIGNFCETNEWCRWAITSFCTCFHLGKNSWPEISPWIGSIFGIFIYAFTDDFSVVWQILSLILFCLAVIYASNIFEKIEGKNNPANIIIDETAGMWVSLFLIKNAEFKVILVSFLLFRFLDFFKLFPINMFQSFKNGKGVLADDLAAGMITNFVIRILLLKGVI